MAVVFSNHRRGNDAGEQRENDMSNEVTIQGVTMTVAAAQVVEAVSVDVAADVRAIRSGEQTRDELLAECLDGAEDESTRAAWHEYVSAVVAEAETDDARAEYEVQIEGEDGHTIRAASDADAWDQAGEIVRGGDWSDCDGGSVKVYLRDADGDLIGTRMIETA